MYAYILSIKSMNQIKQGKSLLLNMNSTPGGYFFFWILTTCANYNAVEISTNLRTVTFYVIKVVILKIINWQLINEWDK